jgi:hypothetical protein
MLSNIFSKIFSRGLIRFLAALGIPAGLIGFWFYASHQADVQLGEYQKEKKAHPQTDQTTVENYELKEVNDSNQVRWHLRAKHGVMTVDGSNDILLDHPEMKYFDGALLKMRIAAPRGIANETTHIVKLSGEGKDRVIAENVANKGRMIANNVQLNKRNQFIAKGGVNIDMPGVAKVTGNQAEGALEKDSSLKNFKIFGNTHAVIGGKSS